MEQKFYECGHCGNILTGRGDTAAPGKCCGGEMKEILPGKTDGALEKHMPVYHVDKNAVTVDVGSTAHPMAHEHYIEWVMLQTKQGEQRKYLRPGDAPQVRFALCDGDEVEAVYAYCNQHSLWKAS